MTTDITELAQSMSIERIKQIALGGQPTIGEKERLAITALYFHKELQICTKAFQTAGLNQLAAEEALEAKDADAEWMRKRITGLGKELEVSEERRVKWFQMAQELGEKLDAADQRNAEMVEALEKAQRANGHLREQSAEWERKAISNFEDCAEMSARIEELESQRKLAFTACNRWADKFREAEKRIAELDIESAVKDASILELKQQYQRLLESRTVTVRLPSKIERGDADGWFMYNGGRVGGGAAEWYNKALDDVGAELAAAGIREAE